MTADQTIALTSIVAGAVVGAAGLIVGGLGGRWDRGNARQMAAHARTQDRLERTYDELIVYLDRQRNTANHIRPFMVWPGMREDRPITEDELERVRANVIAHASTEVWALLDEFNKVMLRIENADLAM